MAAPARSTVKQTKFIFVTGGVVSSLGKGLASASIGALLETRGLKVTIQKLDPYINVDPGTMNPHAARRGLRHRRRRRDRSRPRPLRALHLAADDAAEQLHHRPDLPDGHPEGAARRVPGRHRAGHSARHRRDQGAHPRLRRRATTCSSSRSAAPSATSSRCRSSRRIRQLRIEVGAAERDLACTSRWCRTSPPRASSRPSRRSTRSEAARDRHPARHPALPLRAPARAGAQEEDRAVLQRRRRRGLLGRGRRLHLRGAAPLPRARASTTRSASCSTSGRARPS